LVRLEKSGVCPWLTDHLVMETGNWAHYPLRFPEILAWAHKSNKGSVVYLARKPGIGLSVRPESGSWYYEWTPIKGLSPYYVYTWDCRASPEDDTSLDARVESHQGLSTVLVCLHILGVAATVYTSGPPQLLTRCLL
jgi:hypothetical protein